MSELRQANVLVVEDHPCMLAGILTLLAPQPDLRCCGQADSIAATRAALTACKPDLVLLDLRLKDGDGFALLKLIKSQDPQVRVLVLSQFDDVVFAETALQMGAAGYVVKDAVAEELLNAIYAVLAGRIHLSETISAGLNRVRNRSQVSETNWA